jgi:hypothetical protein
MLSWQAETSCLIDGELRIAMDDIAEGDWKKLRALKPVLLDRLCDQILQGVLAIANSTADSSHERYLKLFRYIYEQDKHVSDAFNGHSRSTALMKLAVIRSLGLLTDEELNRFSEPCQEWLKGFGE